MSRLNRHLTEDRVADALQLLAETDEPCAELRANMDRTEFKAKSLKEAAFSTLSGTVAERTAAAINVPAVQEAFDAHFKSIRDYHAMANKRALEELVIRVWQSAGANRRQGG
jgi:cell pole-organizing protein PopZ